MGQYRNVTFPCYIKVTDVYSWNALVLGMYNGCIWRRFKRTIRP